MKHSNEEMEAALLVLYKNEKPIYAFLGALIGGAVGISFFVFFSAMDAIIVFMLAVPPICIGLFARFTGSVFKIKHRLPIGVIGAIVHIAGCYLLQLSPLAYILTPVAFGIAMQLSKIKLNRVQSYALYQEEIGGISVGKNNM